MTGKGKLPGDNVKKASPRHSATGTSRTTPRRDRRHGESGDTLIEILITLVVLGMASVALIIAFGTSISASADHRQLSASGIVLDSISQEVISDIQNWQGPSGNDPGALFQCGYVYQNYVNATAATFASTNPSLPSNFTAGFATTDPLNEYPIEYWNTASNAFSTGDPAVTNSCAAGQPQLIDITIIDTTTHQPFTNSFVVDSPLDTVSGSGPSGSYGTASQLVFTTSPSGATTGGVFTTQPVITVEDQNGNAVQDDLSPVLLNLYSVTDGPVTNGAVLSGCAGGESLGVVTFSGCTISVAGSYDIVATDEGLTSLPVAITVNPTTDYLKFTTEPTGGQSGQALGTPSPTVTVYKANGTKDTSWTGTITLTTSGGTLSNCPAATVTAGQGAATFNNCDFAGAIYYDPTNGQTLATPYTMTAAATSSVSTSPATSTAFSVTSAGAASQMVFSQQPTGSASNTLPSAFVTQPIVTLEDSFGNSETSSTASVTLSISSGTLEGCTAPVVATNGSATYSGCSGSQDGTGLTLTAKSTGLSPATSALFNITGVASQLVFTTQPSAGVSGTSFLTEPVVTIEDAAGKTVTASNASISLSSVVTNVPPYTPGGLLQLCTNLIPYEGVVSVQTCTFAGIVGNPYYLLATQGTLSTVSVAFSPTAAGTPTQLTFVTQPVGGPAGLPLTTQPVVAVEDSGGNIVNTSTVTIGLTASGGTLSSCSQLQSTSGLVDVQGCTFGGLDTVSYTLSASASGLTSAQSANFGPSGPGPVSPTLSTVVASPGIVQDNGTAASTVTVTLEDAYTNVIPGDSVMLAQGAASSVISPASVPSGSNGVAVFSVTDTHQEIATYTANDVTESTALAEQAQVSFATQLTLPTGVTLTYGTTAGSIGVSFTAPSNAPTTGQTYTATVCTTSAMGCGVTYPVSPSGTQITGLAYTQGSPGTAYYVTVAANASTGYLASTTTYVGPQNATSQVKAPASVTVTPSTTTAGAFTVTFPNSGGTAPSSYSASACTSSNMQSGCNAPQAIVSGGQITGLTAGTPYYVGIVANPPTGYVSAESTIVGPYTTTAQLVAPTGVTLSYGTTAGSIGVSFTGSLGAPGGQTYAATVCTTSAMGCGVTYPVVASGTQITGLAYTQGNAGTSYYVTVTANASTGYLAATTAYAGPQNATSQVNAPTGVTVTPSTTTAGAIVIAFSAPSGTTPSSYTATVCTTSAMGCGTTDTVSASGTQITGLTAGTMYYVTVTSNPPTGYVSATSTPAASGAATRQLAAPTGVTLSAGSTGGSLTVTFTAPNPAASGQTYTATVCTTSAMGCGVTSAVTSGGQITGLTPGTKYYVTVTADASPGYLVSPASIVSAGLAATIQLVAPTGVTLSYGTAAGSIGVSFTGSLGAPGGQTYTATVCTTSAMGCGVTYPVVASGTQITGLAYTQGNAGTSYYVTVTANASTGYLAATTAYAGPQNATSQLSAPTAIVSSSTTTAGQIVLALTAPSAQAPSSYTGQVCTSPGGVCSASQSFTTGTTPISGLTAGQSYAVNITANAPAGFLSSSAVGGPAMATVQIGSISPTATFGSTAGSLTVTFSTPTSAATSQTYTAEACQNSNLTGNCVTVNSFTSGSQITGLAFTQGSAGTPYYVTVTANASPGYLASSAQVGPQADTSQVDSPTITSVTSGTSTTSGSLTVNFTNSLGSGVSSYTAAACTSSGGPCGTAVAITTGSQITGLTAGSPYYVQLTALGSTGYASSAANASSSTIATKQLNAPTGVTLNYGTTAGSISVSFTASNNGPSTGQTYTATVCTTSAMGCGVTYTVVASGTQITGLAYTPGSAGTSYYVTVSADGSSGYLVSPASTAVSPQPASSQYAAPVITSLSGGGKTGFGNNAYHFTVNFTESGTAPTNDYTVTACTNAAMNANCVSVSTVTGTGYQLTGLTQTGYFFTVEANAAANSSYASNTSAVYPTGPTGDTP
jgi:type II secretory pathway pseudopilin PulG